MKPEKIKHFINEQHSDILFCLNKNTNEKGDINWPKFFASYHAHLSSTAYKSACAILFEPSNITDNNLLCGLLMSSIRKKVIETSSRSRNDVSKESNEGQINSKYVCDQSKIRYIGGYAVAKVKHHYLKSMRRSLSSQILDYSCKNKIDLLDHITKSHEYISQNTSYPQSLDEITNKQNISFSLTNISDAAFEFFMILENKRLLLHNDNNLQKYRDEILNTVKSDILNDSKIFQLFVQLFTSSLLYQDSAETDEIINVMDDLLSSVDDLCSIFTELVVRYLKVANNQYRKNLLVLFGKKKSMEHRKKVLQKQAISNSRTMCTYQSIKSDSSHQKIYSHVVLTKLDETSFCRIFKKSELCSIGQAYGIKFLSKDKKQNMIYKLKESILKCDQMPYSHKIQ